MSSYSVETYVEELLALRTKLKKTALTKDQVDEFRRAIEVTDGGSKRAIVLNQWVRQS